MSVYVWEKWMRCIEVARDNRLPFINLVESAGADLRGRQDTSNNQARQLDNFHFASSGRTFYEMTELSKLKIPVVSVVFGSSTAGEHINLVCLTTIFLSRINLRHSLQALPSYRWLQVKYQMMRL